MYYDPFDVLFSGTNAVHPKMDVVESEKEYKIYMDIPGLNKDQIEIELNRDVLSVSGIYPKTDDAVRYHKRERFVGSFKRQLKLGSLYTQEDIVAEFNNGTLILTIAKKPEEKLKRILIT